MCSRLYVIISSTLALIFDHLPHSSIAHVLNGFKTRVLSQFVAQFVLCFKVFYL